ncbi:MAG: hypothetical protein JO021_01010 [Alphaproteobacteria bacterium]|nr:hypothetical protein [Alphaproteobacteria bacterium]
MKTAGGALGATLWAAAAAAQTDEIQVYNGEIVAPGQFGLTLHNNYIAIGRKQADFPGGVRPDGSLNGVTEFTYGVNEWFELGAYMPFLYTVTHDGQFLLNGAKLRALVVSPGAKDRTFFYGLNVELSYSAKHWQTERPNTEFRPILGLHLGRWELIVNPIIDLPLGRHMQPELVPASRIAYALSDTLTLGLEHYAGYGTIPNFEPGPRQAHTGYVVLDWALEPYDVEFGVGHGFTAASDALVFKLLISRSF